MSSDRSVSGDLSGVLASIDFTGDASSLTSWNDFSFGSKSLHRPLLRSCGWREMRDRIVAQTGLTGEPKKRTRFSNSRSLKRTKILCRHLKESTESSELELVFIHSQYYQFTETRFNVEIVDVVAAA